MLFLTAFYAPLLPLGTFICVVNLIGYYLALKYLFIRRLSIPRNIGLFLSIEMTKMMEFVPLIFGISCVVFNTIYDHDFGYWAYILIFVSSVYIILPVESIWRYFNLKKFKEHE